MIKKLYGRLHYGELEVIVGAKELDIPLAIIDEKRKDIIRVYAKRMPFIF